MSCECRRGERGFTLIEAMVSMGLLAMLAASVGSLLIGHLRIEVTNTTTTTAISLAEQELEDLRGLEYADVASRHHTVTDGVEYTVDTVVQGDVPEENMKQIAVDVTWNDSSGQKSCRVDAIFTDITR